MRYLGQVAAPGLQRGHVRLLKVMVAAISAAELSRRTKRGCAQGGGWKRRSLEAPQSAKSIARGGAPQRRHTVAVVMVAM